MMSAEDPPLSVASGRVRKLAALLSADVEGYSRLMGEDEAATVHTLTAYRAAIQTLVQEHRGRVVDSSGDDVLAEFASKEDSTIINRDPPGQTRRRRADPDPAHRDAPHPFRTLHIDPRGHVLVAQHTLPMDVRDGDAVLTNPAGLSVFRIGDDASSPSTSTNP
jgi:class 3 adenylate cyclase